jgi:hypothetical protein
VAGPRDPIRSWLRRSWRRGAALAVALSAFASLAFALPARAANIFETGIEITGFGFDPSVRSQAMGGASGAMFWGRDPNYWANPALLGFIDGIAYEDATYGTLADEDANSRRLTLGYGGIGLATAGPPFSGLTQFEFEIPDFGAHEETHAWGIGVSVSRMLSTIAGLRGQEPPAITRYADIAFGYNHKTDNLADVFGEIQTIGMDWGVLARGTAPFRLGSSGVPARAEAAYGYSVQNANDATFAGQSNVDRPHHHGLAARFALDQPEGWRKHVPAWLAPGLDPLVSLGGAWDRVFVSAGDGPTFGSETHLGGELGLANVAFLRLGSDDNSHDWGYALALPLGTMGGFQYSESQRKLDYGTTLKSHAWLLWLNPVEIARTLRAPHE